MGRTPRKEDDDMKRTTIQVTPEVKDKLDEIKIHRRETYNDLVIKLLEKYNDE